MSRKDYRRGRRTFNGPASGYGPRMPRYEVEKRHEDGTSTREPYESPHEFAPGDSFMTGGDRWQVESVDGERLVAVPARSGEVPTDHTS